MLDLDVVPPLLTELVAQSFLRAGVELSALLGWPLKIEHPFLALVPLEDATGVFGGEAAEAVAIHASFSGDLSGQLLLLLTPGAAQRLAAACLGGEIGAWGPMPELATSFLSEVGNVAGASVVNAVADRFGITVVISPPEVVTDMAGAILGTLVPLSEAAPDRVLLMRTAFRGARADVGGLFLLLPDRETLARLASLLSEAADV